MRYLMTAVLILVGIIHLLPLAGVSGAERIQSLYGVTLGDPNVVILMRHRAVLFGLLGTFFIVAAFVPALQLSALILGTISVISFLLLAWSTGGYNASIARVVTADWIALALLLVGFVAYALLRRRF